VRAVPSTTTPCGGYLFKRAQRQRRGLSFALCGRVVGAPRAP